MPAVCSCDSAALAGLCKGCVCVCLCVVDRAVEEVKLFGNTLPGLDQLLLLTRGEKSLE